MTGGESRDGYCLIFLGQTPATGTPPPSPVVEESLLGLATFRVLPEARTHVHRQNMGVASSGRDSTTGGGTRARPRSGAWFGEHLVVCGSPSHTCRSFNVALRREVAGRAPVLSDLLLHLLLPLLDPLDPLHVSYNHPSHVTHFPSSHVLSHSLSPHSFFRPPGDLLRAVGAFRQGSELI